MESGLKAGYLEVVLVLVSQSRSEGQSTSLQRRVFRHLNRTGLDTNRLRSLVRKKVKRIIKAKKLSKPGYETGIIDRLNR